MEPLWATQVVSQLISCNSAFQHPGNLTLYTLIYHVETLADLIYQLIPDLHNDCPHLDTWKARVTFFTDEINEYRDIFKCRVVFMSRYSQFSSVNK